MHQVVISGAGLWKPDNVVTNAELVESYNAYATRFNTDNARAIDAGELAEWGLDLPGMEEEAEEREVEISDDLQKRFVLEVECEFEKELQSLFGEMKNKGYKCKVLK